MLGLLGVATLAASVSLAVVQNAAERYRRYISDFLADDPARDAFLSLLFIGFVVTLAQLALVTMGVLRPALGLVAPFILAIAAFGLLTQYVRRRISWLKPSAIVAYMARDIRRHAKSMLMVPSDVRTAAALSAKHRQAAHALLRLLSLALDGLAENAPGTIDDAMEAYRAYTGAVVEHARARLGTEGPVAAILVSRTDVSLARLATLRDKHLLEAILAKSRSREGLRRPTTPSADEALWFEQIASRAAIVPLYAVLVNGRGRDDEFADDWCEQIKHWLKTTREDGDLAMGMAVLVMLEHIPPMFDDIARAGAPTWPLPGTVLDDLTEAAAAVLRTPDEQSTTWSLNDAWRSAFLTRAASVYARLVVLTSADEQQRQRSRAKDRRSRLAALGWVSIASAEGSDTA